MEATILYETDFHHSYESLEVGFPSHEEPLINKYAETEHEWTNTVYICVPVNIIQQVIDKHGGINLVKTFE